MSTICVATEFTVMTVSASAGTTTSSPRMSVIVRSCGSPCVSLVAFWLWPDWLSEAAWSLCEQPNSVPVASAMVKIAAMALFLETLMEPSPFAPRAPVASW